MTLEQDGRAWEPEAGKTIAANNGRSPWGGGRGARAYDCWAWGWPVIRYATVRGL